MSQTFCFTVGADDAGARLDEFLAARLGRLSRMRIASLVAAGACAVGGVEAHAGRRLRAGDAVEIALADGAAPGAMTPEPLPLDILHEDEHLLVVVKPAGLLAHPTRGVKTGTLANALAHHLNRWRIAEFGIRIEEGGVEGFDGNERDDSEGGNEKERGEKEQEESERDETERDESERNESSPAGAEPDARTRTSAMSGAVPSNPQSEFRHPQSEASAIRHPPSIRPGLVHRLDRETSGLMVVAKTQRALSILSRQFHKRRVEKRYLALVGGRVAADALTVEAPIGRAESGPPWWGVREEGRAAETRLRVVGRRGQSSLVELEPVTGRTNQLRIHCAHAGHAIVGDIWYGGAHAPRLCLHAARLAFNHPEGGARVEFESPLPAEIAVLFQ